MFSPKRKTLMTFLLLGMIPSFSNAGRAEHIPDGLKPFAPLVGKTFIGAFPEGGAVDEQRFEWVYQGKFLRNTHEVKGPKGRVVYKGETIYAWNLKTGKIDWFYWNLTGGYIVGTMERVGDDFVFEGVNTAPSPQPQRVKGRLRNFSEDGFESVSYFLRDDRWEERFTIQFRPKQEKPALVPTAETYLEHYFNGEIEALRPLISENCVFEDTAMSLRGADQMIKGLAHTFSAIKDLHFESHRRFTSAAYAVTEGQVRFRLHGSQVNGSDQWFELDIPMTVVLKLVDGKVVHHQDLLDQAAIAEQLAAQTGK